MPDSFGVWKAFGTRKERSLKYAFGWDDSKHGQINVVISRDASPIEVRKTRKNAGHISVSKHKRRPGEYTFQQEATSRRK